LRGSLPVWVYFKDKEGAEAQSLDKALLGADRDLSVRCLRRRAKVRESSCLVDSSDLPVNPLYIEAVAPLVKKIRAVSRWLNAVSVDVSPAGIAALRRLPFVREVDLVLSFARNEPSALGEVNEPLDVPDQLFAFYGPSFVQINQIHVWPLHRAGFSGRGVLVCMMDSGFRKSHEIFRSARLVGEWDFVNGDADVEQNLADPNDYSDSHGTGTWSILGGYKPGVLIGPAYGADFLLAKTETEKFEQPIEEDYWVAGIEWAESLGADVVSSSLGYIDWYSFADMDGKTAVTTRAANRAVSLGVVVVNAAGNERDKAWRHIIAPADGFDVIACGAVDATGAVSSFSSPGPTFDGRIKPEVCALGVRNWLASNRTDGSSTYSRGDGTSFSTPLVAGAAALLLEIHPDWTPAQVRAALLSTASRSQAPDNDFGWGIVDAALAADIGLTSISLSGYEWDDDASGKSTGNGNGRAEPGETIEITVTLANRSRFPAAGLSGRLSALNPGVGLVSSTVPFLPLPGLDSGASSAPFVVKIPLEFPARHAVFKLRVESQNGLELYENLRIQVFR
jgi:subtilisin family serine protease